MRGLKTRIVKYCLRLVSPVLIVATIFGIIGPGAAVIADSWYNASWHYRDKITINAAGVTGTSANFPVLITFTNDALLGAKAQSNGNDIVFTSSDKLTQIPHEIEKYSSNGVTANLTAWVNVPSISSLANTDIYMYYGNGATASMQNPSAVWDSNYKMVQHLEETAGGANAIKDSTVNNINGTDYNTPTFGATGKIDGAISFAKASLEYIQLPASNTILNADNFTIESWFTTTLNHPVYGIGAMEGRILNLHRGATAGSAVSLYVEQNKVGLFYYNGTTSFYLTYTVNYYNGVPHNLAATHNPIDNTYRLYYDGVSVNSSVNTFVGFGTYPAFLGTHNGTERNFDGIIDEARISSTARSAGWIATSYSNQNNPAGFITRGSQENNFVLPTVTTGNVSFHNFNQATLNGNITATGGENPYFAFEWGTVSGVYTANSTWIGPAGVGAVQWLASPLNAGALYYYRFKAKNTAGIGYGTEKSFLTDPVEPSNFTITSQNTTAIGLTWTKGAGAGRTYIRKKIAVAPANMTDGDFVYYGTANVTTDTSIVPGNAYVYRAWSEITQGSYQEYSPASAIAVGFAYGTPYVSSVAASSVQEQTATLNGYLDNTSGPTSQYSFEWGTAPGVYTANTSWTGSITSGTPFSAAIGGLQKGTVYYFRARAYNGMGTGYGAELHFLTKPDPPASFTANVTSAFSVHFTWTMGTGAGQVMIRRGTVTFPATISDGIQVYLGGGTSWSDNTVGANTTYYYSIWSEKSGSQQFSNVHLQAQVNTPVVSPFLSVGGKVYTVNKALIVLPWLLVSFAAVIIIVRVALYIRKKARRAGH
jgi:hypothetical protein